MHYRNVIFGSVSTLSAVNAMLTSNRSSSFELKSNLTAPIEIVGSKFFNSQSGEQFFLKGLTYQPTIATESWNSEVLNSEAHFVDPLAEPSLCLRDLEFFEKLNVNTIRVYSVDSERNHDICMEALANKGIYVLADLSEPDKSIRRDRPSWDIPLFERYTAVVDAMQKYPNMLGFFAGNEVTNDDTNTDASPFVKAAIRDIKEYIQKNEYRKIPVGYSSNDDAATREYLAKYFACDGEGAADFYGINMYEWCGYSSYASSGYRERTLEFTDYPIPVFFSEFGCNTIRPRPFTEVSAIFGPKMSKVWSGGLVYMYFEEENGYGLVKIDESGSVHELEDFRYLQNAYKNTMSYGTTKEKYLQDANFGVSSQFTQCPNEVSTEQARKSWKASTKLPPTPNSETCHCLEQVLPCVVTSSLSGRNLQDNFDYACSQVDCSDIAADGEKGTYGEFSYCLPEQKLALEISKIYNRENNHLSGVCPMGGNNVFFNGNGLNVTDLKCAEIFRKLQLVENKPKLFGADSGSSTMRFKHSGYAILFVSFIFATMVF